MSSSDVVSHGVRKRSTQSSTGRASANSATLATAPQQRRTQSGGSTDDDDSESESESESSTTATPVGKHVSDGAGGEVAVLKSEHAHVARADGSSVASKRSAHYAPAHVAVQASLLTSSQLHSMNFSGLVNLAALLLLIVNVRLVFENLHKHGWLFGSWFVTMGVAGLSRDDWQVIGVMAGSLLPCGAMLWSERLCARNGTLWRESANGRLQKLMIALLLGVPSTVILLSKPWPHISSCAMSLSMVLAMKMTSYYLTNRDIRRVQAKTGGKVLEEVEGVATPVTYPDNLTVANLAYFLAAPTLCYQLNYPRTPSIRWPFVLRRTAQMVFLMVLAAFITEQYLAPTVRGTSLPTNALAYSILFERVLKLAVPSLYVWLLFFAIFFHYYLNVLAELLRFGDRKFYGDWWNASSLGFYWREWNLPVHTWLVRHVYAPARKKGMSKFVAGFLTFFVSAVAHEAVISIPCHIFALHAFFAMMAQLPLVALTSKIKQGSVYGNIFFWFSFTTLGQPMAVLLYYWTYQVWATMDVRNSLKSEVEQLIAKMSGTI